MAHLRFMAKKQLEQLRKFESKTAGKQHNQRPFGLSVDLHE
jgi:hypothetical protein